MTDLDPTHYNPLVMEASATSRVVVRLGSRICVFYATMATRELRIQAHDSQTIYTLLQDVIMAHGFIRGGLLYIYAVTVNGSIKLLTYRYFGDPTPVVTDIVIPRVWAIHVHTMHQHGWFLMTLFDGGQVYILKARDAAFTQAISTSKLYSNILNPTFFVDKPTLGMHPEDYQPSPGRSRITVGVDRMNRSTGVHEVGFFIHETLLD